MRTLLVLIAFALFCPSVTAQKPEPKYKGKPLAYWVERLQKGETDKDQLEAAEALKVFGPDAKWAVPTLVEMLDDRSYVYQRMVTEILCEIGPAAKEAVPDLLKRLKEKQAQKPPKGKVFENSIEMLYLIKILGAIGPDAKDAVPILISFLDQSEGAIQIALGHSLCNIEAREAIPAFRKLVQIRIANWTKTNERPSDGLLKEWDEIAFPFELHKLGSEILPFLLELLDERSVYAKHLAMREIANLDSASIKKAMPKLVPLLRSDQPCIRFHSAVMLWKIEKNPASVPILAALLSENDDQLKHVVMESLGEIGPDAKEALPALRDAISNRSVSVFEASETIRKIESSPRGDKNVESSRDIRP